ncbi:hypothetical protein GCM10022204_05610 [Microlunatus aurantiacus]|uniref:Uncharacterized protein n=1 Tax=Microlunatus aurantiacus TaxID=446786 RepID=A0ABP7CR21_9ACTN
MGPSDRLDGRSLCLRSRPPQVNRPPGSLFGEASGSGLAGPAGPAQPSGRWAADDEKVKDHPFTL